MGENSPSQKVTCKPCPTRKYTVNTETTVIQLVSGGGQSTTCSCPDGYIAGDNDTDGFPKCTSSDSKEFTLMDETTTGSTTTNSNNSNSGTATNNCPDAMKGTLSTEGSFLSSGQTVEVTATNGICTCPQGYTNHYCDQGDGCEHTSQTQSETYPDLICISI